MSLGRILSFIVLIVLLGLVQLWALLLIVNLTGINIEFSQLVEDGSLFFFSTTLAYASFFAVVTSPYKYGIDDPPFYLGPSALHVLAAKIAVPSQTPPDSAHPSGYQYSASRYMHLQLFCAVSAVAYAFYVSKKTDVFLGSTTTQVAVDNSVTIGSTIKK